ncbi:MAG TPA: transglycosylase SLT domain-containing protein [Phenylobacterium sp.]|uniref:lytic transglycosylase domain-containing protein n=1 Tax=Phenylobacterium sp. TaxID=1871053 RepID=UPI002B6E2955|nr:transglycosylase SLT domain-containing protein [Phenylobacterium sp.]HXA40494.1 transglycosylase SLT domain-containing protein [Phenylobacterium sp.]
MNRLARKSVLIAGVAVMASVAARAQTVDPLGDLLESVTKPSIMGDAPLQPANASHRLSDRDAGLLRQAIEAARRANVNGARDAISQMTDPLARKTATWVLVDCDADAVGFYEVDNARRELAAWPRAQRRQAAAERLLETAGKTPQQVVDWFAGADPATAQGAMALASAYRGLGRTSEATTLVKHWWRDKSFDETVQRTMLGRFGDILTADDHLRRVDVLLYGKELAAARDMLGLLPADQQGAARARLALRGDARDATDLVAALPPELAQSPGVAFERAAYLRRRGMDMPALEEVAYFPHEVTSADQGDRIWEERRHLVLSALRAGDAHAAYAAAADSGLTAGSPGADAEFDAGWVALTKLSDPAKAARHFANLERIGTSPVTRGRAFYWEGRAAEARGDKTAAQGFYAQAARYNTCFYGMLAAEKLGQRLTLASDPTITPQARGAFEARDEIAATRLLFDYGQRELFKVFVLNLDDILPTAEDEAQLVDLARGYGEMELSMKAARGAAQRGFILPQRAYPLRSAPDGGAAEPALVLAITRQESSFDPNVRSGAGARGMMQLMPATAKILARRSGISYSPSQLDEPEYNMRLGANFLGQLVSQFSGSYIMAAAGYNAGPGRPTQWTQFCGDPRGGSTDPVDYIECIPFSETRNYVMRVMENMQVYRAKMAGGSIPITLSADLKRGAYGAAPVNPLPTLADTAATTGR